MDWKKGISRRLMLTTSNIIRPGDVILFHDDNDLTLDVLPLIIEELKNKEFQFLTVEEMIKRESSLD